MTRQCPERSTTETNLLIRPPHHVVANENAMALFSLKEKKTRSTCIMHFKRAKTPPR